MWLGRYWRYEKYLKKALGHADDRMDADGQQILSFKQAQQAVLSLSNQVLGASRSNFTIAEAASRYMEWFREHRKAVRETEHVIRAHILPALGNCLLADVSAALIRKWTEQLAAQPPRVRTSRFVSEQRYRDAPKTSEQKRARRATANRIYTVLKAILNRAFQDGLVADDTPWRQVKPFPKVDEARIRFLTDDEAVRLVKACRHDLQPLVRGALLTGARFGELRTLRVQDVKLSSAQIYVSESKSGRPRHIPLNAEGVQLFRGAIRHKDAEQLLFVKHDGKPWGKNHHVRALVAACHVAKIRPSISFHELRHTYASHLAQAGIDLLTISKLLGHADTRVTSRHYAHLADKTLAEAVNKLPKFGGAGSRKLQTG